MTRECWLAGRVVDGRTGEPVDGAVVCLFGKDTLEARFVEVAPDGSFEIEGVPAGSYTLAVRRAAGYQPQTYSPDGESHELTLVDKERRPGIVFKLEPGQRITGRVLDEKGEPLAGTHGMAVVAQAGTSSVRAQAAVGPDGRYEIDGLNGEPVYVRFQDFRSEQRTDAYPVRYWPGVYSRADAVAVTFDAGRLRDGIDIPLDRKGGIAVSGRVADAVTGVPIGDALIVVHGDVLLFDRVTAYTDADGRYHLEGLGSGAMVVHADATPQGYVRTTRRLLLEDARPQVPLDLVLNRGVTLAGRIVDEKGDELPIVAQNTYGSAHVQEWSPSRDGTPLPMRAYSGVQNRFAPAGVGNGSVTYLVGEGDDGVGSMIFPSRSTFLVLGMMPGNTQIRFRASVPGKEVLRITVDGRDVTNGGLVTRAGQTVDDVRITVGARPK